MVERKALQNMFSEVKLRALYDKNISYLLYLGVPTTHDKYTERMKGTLNYIRNCIFLVVLGRGEGVRGG